MQSVETILKRVDHLRDLNNPQVRMRHVIRALMDGGPDAVAEMVSESEMEHMPAANLLYSGIERTSQKLLHPPQVRVDAPLRGGSRTRKAAEKRERIVEAYDLASRVKMQMPQAVRWLMGYGFTPWVVQPSKTEEDQPYPSLELRDPYGCLPGPWTVHQQPRDIAFVRVVSEEFLADMYGSGVLPKAKPGGYDPGTGLWSPGLNGQQWEQQASTRTHNVVEYMDDSGTYMVLEQTKTLLEYAEVPKGVGTPFVVAKRFSFNQLQGQFQHVIGLQQMLTRMNILAFLAVQDAVFAETNVYGEMVSDEYRKGRDAVNIFQPGTRVEKVTEPGVFQSFQQQDRLERQLRMVGAYPVTDDAQSPNSYVTGQGLDTLTASSDNVVTEYQVVLSDVMERADTKRLKWDEKAFGTVERTMPSTNKGAPAVETFVPEKHIQGQYQTRRVYGLLSGLESSQKLVGLLQTSQAGWIDNITAMENIDGIDNIPLVLERLEQQQTEALLEQAMLSTLQGQPMDLRVLQVLVDGLPQGDKRKRFEEVFFPEEQPGAVPGQTPPGEQPMAAPGEDPTTILSRLFADGQNTSAVQTVQTV